MAADFILSAVRQFLKVDPSVSITMEPIKKGASGRLILRVKSAVHEPFIGIYWTQEREDNNLFLPVAHFLKQSNIRVPDILFESQSRSVALVQDLGDQDLLSFKALAFTERLPMYRSALEQLNELFYLKAPKDFELMPDFSAATYRWEQEYFFDHVVEGYLNLSSEKLKSETCFLQLAERLGKISFHLVHRDFQSQNIIIHQQQAYLIDFQGMRKGRQEYDLASLIYDPYLNHSIQEQEALMDLWEEISDERPEMTLFKECAIQRLMQAMGAYAKLYQQQQLDWYLPHLTTAAHLLKPIIRNTVYEKPLMPILVQLADD